MPRKSSNSIPPETGLTRMVTRAKNADTHPGNAVRDALRAQRPKEVIQKEKEEKQARKDVAEQVKADAEAGVEAAAQIEAENARAAAKEVKQIPRRRQSGHAKTNIPAIEPQAVTNVETGKKRKASARNDAKQPQNQQNVNKVKPKVRAASGFDEGDTDHEEVPHPHKRSKVGNSAQPLRRTETALEEQGTSLTEADISRIFDDPLTSEADGQMQVDEEECQTPRPQAVHEQDGQNLQAADDEDKLAFETPLARRSRNRVAKPAPLADIEELIDSSEEEIVFKKEQTSSTARHAANYVNNNINKANPKLLSSHFRTNPQNDHALHSRSNSSQATAVRPPASTHSLAFVSSRPISSNKLVGGKATHNTALPGSKKVKTDKKPKQPKIMTNDIVEDSEPERAIGGMESEEDDTLEKQVALSSPMKGSESRQVGKSLIKVKVEKEVLQALTAKVKVEKEVSQALTTKLKVEKEVKPQRRKVQLKDLPDGAKNFNQEVIPVFICLIYAGDIPWPLDKCNIAPHLQIAWDKVYRRRIPFNIVKGSVPYELAVQKLSDLRNKFGTKAISSFFLFYRKNVNPNADIEQDRDGMAEFAASLMPNKFIYKGMEDLENPKKTGTFRHQIFLETLSAFMGFLDDQVLSGMYRARDSGIPLCSLAIAACAVERAVKLFKEKMIDERVDSRGVRRLVVRKVENPETKKSSGYSTDFSWELWNTAAQQYMQSIKAHSQQRIMEILKETFDITDGPGRRNPFIQVDSETSNSARASLHSDDEDLETSGCHSVNNTQYQTDDDSCNSDTSTQHTQVHGGVAANDADTLEWCPLTPACNDADNFFICRPCATQASESQGTTDNTEGLDHWRPRPRKKSGQKVQQK